VAIGAVLIGLGYGPITPASSHLLTRTTPAHRMSLVFSIKQTGVPLGVAMAGGIAPSLQQWWGWQCALLAVAAACVLCALLSQTLRREFDADRNPEVSLRMGAVLDPVRMVLRDPGLRMLALCSFVFAIAQLSLTAYAVLFLTDSLAYGLIAAGAVLAVSQVGGIIGRVGWGYASDRWIGARRTLAILAVLMSGSALATACLVAGTPHWVIAGVLFVFGISAIGWNGVYLAEVARQAPVGKAGLATGGTLAITFMGNVLGPVMFGALAGVFQSYRAGFLGLALLLALCVVMLVRWAMAEHSGA
jgi:predicted MFS family arabinose efflux permease